MERVFNQKLLHVGGSHKGKEWQRLYLRLPSDWTKMLGLVKGDEVSVRVDGNCLIVWREMK